jgi:hypothetical protein
VERYYGKNSVQLIEEVYEHTRIASSIMTNTSRNKYWQHEVALVQETHDFIQAETEVM